MPAIARNVNEQNTKEHFAIPWMLKVYYAVLSQKARPGKWSKNKESSSDTVCATLFHNKSLEVEIYCFSDIIIIHYKYNHSI